MSGNLVTEEEQPFSTVAIGTPREEGSSGSPRSRRRWDPFRISIVALMAIIALCVVVVAARSAHSASAGSGDGEASGGGGGGDGTVVGPGDVASPDGDGGGTGGNDGANGGNGASSGGDGDGGNDSDSLTPGEVAFARAIAGHASSSGDLFTVYSLGTDSVLLELRSDTLGAQMFTCSAILANGDGSDMLYHSPVTELDNWFVFAEAPRGATAPGAAAGAASLEDPLIAPPNIDLVQPELSVRMSASRGHGLDEAFARGANYSTIVTTFTPVGARPCPGAARGCVSYLIDATRWVQSGLTVFSVPLSGMSDIEPRVLRARAFPRNAEFSVAASLAGEALVFHLSLVALPDAPMTPRLADDRLGTFSERYTDASFNYSSGAGPAVAIKHRWRLVKKDPGAAVSDPVQQIVYHVDPTVPPKWRPFLKAGIEAWNPAFEAAGFSNAVRARVPGDPDWPADYDAADARYSSVSWSLSVDQTFGLGPSDIDPRTGELLNADIIITTGWIAHYIARYVREGIGSAATRGQQIGQQIGRRGHRGAGHRFHHARSGAARRGPASASGAGAAPAEEEEEGAAARAAPDVVRGGAESPQRWRYRAGRGRGRSASGRVSQRAAGAGLSAAQARLRHPEDSTTTPGSFFVSPRSALFGDASWGGDAGFPSEARAPFRFRASSPRRASGPAGPAWSVGPGGSAAWHASAARRIAESHAEHRRAIAEHRDEQALLADHARSAYEADLAAARASGSRSAVEAVEARLAAVRAAVDPSALAALTTEEVFAAAGLMDVMMHEAGHTLGLRHTFSASTLRTLGEMQDAAVTSREGLHASVMDYTAINTGDGAGNQGEYFMSCVGPYDLLAIRHSYTPIPGPGGGVAGVPGRVSSSGTEIVPESSPALDAIAAEAVSRGLTFCTDEDDATEDGDDPYCNYFDISREPLDFYERQVALAGEMWAGVEARALRPGGDWSAVRYAARSILRMSARAARFAAKYIGGSRVSKARPTDAGVLPAEPVSPDVQRRALALVARVLRAGSSPDPSGAPGKTNPDPLSVPPSILARAVARTGSLGRKADLGFHATVREHRADIIAIVLSPARSARARDQFWAGSEGGSGGLSPGEIITTLGDAVLSPLISSGDGGDASPSVASGFFIDAIVTWLDTLTLIVDDPFADPAYASAALANLRKIYNAVVGLPTDTAADRKAFIEMVQLKYAVFA